MYKIAVLEPISIDGCRLEPGDVFYVVDISPEIKRNIEVAKLIIMDHTEIAPKLPEFTDDEPTSFTPIRIEELTMVKGIGRKKAEVILKHFGFWEDLAKAAEMVDDRLLKLGINPILCKNIADYWKARQAKDYP